MWDAKFGTLLHSFSEHKADVLCLASSADGMHVYASGVDSKVVRFDLLTEVRIGKIGNPKPFFFLFILLNGRKRNGLLDQQFDLILMMYML